MGVARRGFVSTDCADPVPLAEFWAAMLGGEIMFTTEETADVHTEWVWLSAGVGLHAGNLAGWGITEAAPPGSRGGGSGCGRR